MNIWMDRSSSQLKNMYSGQKAPVTLGHEFSEGEIVEVGARVKLAIV